MVIIFDQNGESSSDSDQRPFTRSLRDNGLEKGSVLKKLTQNTNKFMENFNPETSARERRKLHRKLTTSGPKKNIGALYDENGIHITTGQDVCDCLFRDCPGCFFPCYKCNSIKCGNECRANRKYIYEQVDFEGCDITMKNGIGNKK